MYQIIKNFFVYLITAITLYCLQVTTVYLLFFPFNQINIPLLFFIWKIIYRGETKYLWAMVPFYILIDLFSTFSFGVPILAAVISLVLTKRIFYTFFTTFSWYIILMLGFIVFTIYKFIIFFVLYAIPLLRGETILFNSTALYSSLFEICLNAAVLMLLYSVYNLFRVRRRYNYTF